MSSILSWSALLLLCAAYARGKSDCDKTYDLIGCYGERNPGVLLFNDRHNIDWNHIEKYMKKLACKCSAAAKAGGYAGFAMHYYGECYGRTSDQVNGLGSKAHQAHRCVGDQTYTECNKAIHDHCTGGEYAEAIYKFKTAAEESVNGGLGEWEQWTPCDKDCGSGHRHRERNCNNPVPKGSGKDCTELGPLSQRMPCKIKECPVDGGWSEFGEYGECSVSCGGGIKLRNRACTNPIPAHGGEPCIGKSEESAACNVKNCPVNGGWSGFTTDGKCSRSCGGGVQKRVRKCNNPEPAFNGEPCAGSAEETTSCNTQRCPVNGGWSAYGAYGPCSKVCDGGIKKQTRTCSNPPRAHGGNDCTGSSQKTASCNTFKCPDIISCATKYTSYQKHSGGNMVYIDRHRMNCGGTGNILSMFRLQRDGKKMRYQYKCCSFKDKQVCSLKMKTTSFSSDGDGDAVYLDRHTADCGSAGFINDFRIERNSNHDKVRYSYYCCTLKSPWSGKSSCYTSETSMTDDGNGKVYYLDRQTVSCNSGYALSYFKLKRNSAHTKWAYRYRCCKVNY